MKGVFSRVVYGLISGVSPWLLNRNNIYVQDLVILKYRDHYNVSRFQCIVLYDGEVIQGLKTLTACTILVLTSGCWPLKNLDFCWSSKSALISGCCFQGWPFIS